MTIQEIFNYANALTEDAFTDLDEIIVFINEAQDIVCRYDKIEAAPVTTTLTTNALTLPADFLEFHKLTYNDVPYLPSGKPWQGVLELPTTITDGTMKLWYYKKPSALLSTTPTQVPGIDAKYHRALSIYAAMMYFSVDDDPAQRENFKKMFYEILAANKNTTGTTISFTNF